MALRGRSFVSDTEAYQAYRNLGRFFAYRGAKAEAEPLRTAGRSESAGGLLETGRDEFASVFSRNDHYRVDARVSEGRDAGGRLVVVLLRPGGAHALQSSKLEELINRVAGRDGQDTELVLVAPSDVFSSIRHNHLRKIRVARESGKFRACSIHGYQLLVFAVPDCPLVPAHRLLSPQKARAFLAEERLRPSELPRAPENDPPLVWIGAREGDFVQIERYSESAGTAVAVRWVTPPCYKDYE